LRERGRLTRHRRAGGPTPPGEQRDAARPLVNEAFTVFFGGTLPARTIVEVRALNQSDTIEIEAIAARRRAR